MGFVDGNIIVQGPVSSGCIVLHQDVSSHQPGSFCDLLGDNTSMDVDVDSVEAELNAYTRVQEVPLDTDPLMWWKYHVQEFPHLDHMVRQYLPLLHLLRDPSAVRGS